MLQGTMLLLLYMNNQSEEKKDEKKPEEEKGVPAFLEVNVFDKVAGKSVGPGQK